VGGRRRVGRIARDRLARPACLARIEVEPLITNDAIASVKNFLERPAGPAQADAMISWDAAVAPSRRPCFAIIRIARASNNLYAVSQE